MDRYFIVILKTYQMVTEYISLAALFISLSAVGIAVLRFKKESKVKVQRDLVSALTGIIDIVRNDTVREHREYLRDNETMQQIRAGREINFPLDEKTEKAARYVAVAYDKVGFILKHDTGLEGMVLEWHGDDIAEMWTMLKPLVEKEWRRRSPRYAIEFERLGKKALELEARKR